MWTGFGFFFFLILPTRRNSCSLVSSQKSAPGKGIFAGVLRLYLSKSDQRQIVMEYDWSTIMCANMIIYQCGNHCEAAELARSLLEESRNITLIVFSFSIVFFHLKDLAGRGETGVQSIRSPALVPDALRLNTEHLTIILNSILSKSKSYISIRSLPWCHTSVRH